jgi:hypothetical protein
MVTPATAATRGGWTVGACAGGWWVWWWSGRVKSGGGTSLGVVGVSRRKKRNGPAKGGRKERGVRAWALFFFFPRRDAAGECYRLTATCLLACLLACFAGKPQLQERSAATYDVYYDGVFFQSTRRTCTCTCSDAHVSAGTETEANARTPKGPSTTS